MNFVHTFEEFKEILHKHELETGTKFVYDYGRKSFSEQRLVKLTPDLRLHWFDNVPYFHIGGSRVYACHRGKDKNISQNLKNAKKQDMKVKENAEKSFKRVKLSKKSGCPAKFIISRVFTMPEYKVSGELTKTSKKVISTTIKKMLHLDEEVTGEVVFAFNLPSVEEHQNHVIGPSVTDIEPVDERVKEHISSLVYQGKSTAVIAEEVATFSAKELLETDRLKKSFFPDLLTIRQIINQTKSAIKYQKIDQEETIHMLETWDPSNCNFFFRPYTSEIPNSKDTSPVCRDDTDENSHLDECKSEISHMLFVYQSNNMRRLYQRYCRNGILLEAAHRTCKYVLPLYFLLVQTNVNFQVVGLFLTQVDTADALKEALTILRDWTPNVEPKYAVVDHVVNEIESLEAVFLGIQVFIGSFYRDLAWNRWASWKRNVAAIPKDEVLTKLRKIANAATKSDMNKAIKALKTWQPYENTQLKSYFENTWEKEISRWALCFMPDDMYVNSNKSVENLSKELRYKYLESYKNCVVSEFIRLLVIEYLPERYEVYVQKNLQMLSCDFEVPSYLLSRPKWLVDHIQQQLSSVSKQQAYNISNVQKIEFKFPSESKGSDYVVNFNKITQRCSCTCLDNRLRRLVCKHILLIGVKYPHLSLENNYTWMLDNPIFSYDDSVEAEKPDELMEIVQDERSVTVEQQMLNLSESNTRESERRGLVNNIKSHIHKLNSLMPHLREERLAELAVNLENVVQYALESVSKD